MKRNKWHLTTVCLALALVGSVALLAQAGEVCLCEKTAEDMLKSGKKEARSDYWLAIAKSNYLPTLEERQDAMREAKEDLQESTEEYKDQFEARLELCEELGEDIYHPVINPDDFVDYVDNPYFPLVPGTTFTYESETEDGTETVVVTVTDETKEILGVTCTVVRDTEFLDGEMVEDTFDWFAQDNDGNVWYFGEISKEYEDGELVSIEGSWKAGEDGAKPGIIMKANPQVGDLYRQEFALGEAEDVGGVLSLNESVTVPYGSFDNCLMTKDFTPLEPDDLEHKYYAPGIGLVLEVDVESGERVELIDITTE